MKWLGRIFGSDEVPAAAAARLAPSPETQAAMPPTALAEAFELQRHGDVSAAEAAYRRLLDADPADPEVGYFLGRLLLESGRAEAAVPLLERAGAAAGAELHYALELGRALIATRRFAAAVTVYARCNDLQPDCVAMLGDYAGVLMSLDRYEQALPVLERQRELQPESATVHFNLGVIHCAYGRVDEAIAAYRAGMALAPRHAPAFSNLLLQLNYSAAETAVSIASEHRRFGERFAAPHAVAMPDTQWPRQLRIGYVSPDFRDHVVMRFMEGIFANHDDERFEIHCYHTHPLKDAMTQRLRFMVPHWVDAEQLDPYALAARIRADRIDVLVDLAGHTAGNSLLAMAMKPAPLQATYLGYPNTTGVAAIDVRFTDACADPPGMADDLSVEKLIRLPGSYFCYRPGAAVPEVNALPATGADGITFGCFNNFPKLSADFLDAIAAVLQAVPGSRLLLKNRQLSLPRIAASVRGHLMQQGIAAERIELRGWEAGTVEHLSIYHAIDIALDSFPYNGATTTCESLYMGVPVVTLAGDRHAGRMGCSLLTAVGLEELIAADLPQFVAISARLAADIPALAELRSALRGRLQRCSVMDEQGFTAQLEDCYVRLWQDYLRSRNSGALSMIPAVERLSKARAARSGGDLTGAMDLCESVLRENPVDDAALTLLWDLAFDGGEPGSSIEWLNRAIAHENRGRFHYLLGCVMQSQQRWDEAATEFSRALQLDPTLAKACNNLGCVLEASGRPAEAERRYLEATRLDPGLAAAWYNLGNLQAQQGRSAEAAAWLQRALQIDPGHADWHCHLGDLQAQRGDSDSAISHYRAALELDPLELRAQTGLAEALLECGCATQALELLDAAVLRAPANAALGSRRLHVLQILHPDQPALLSGQQRLWAQRHAHPLTRWSPSRRRPAGLPGEATALTIGYLLPDAASPLGHCHLLPLLSAHDRSRCRIVGYGTAPAGVTAAPGQQWCALWRDLGSVSDEEAARILRADRVDVLVDVLGHGNGGRPLLLAQHAARLQCSWLCVPVSAGVDIVLDPLLCFAPPDADPATTAERSGAVVFGSMGPLAALSPGLLRSWAEILRQLPEARLVLLSAALRGQMAGDALLRRCRETGMDVGRVELRAAREGSPAEFADIDIALDTLPGHGSTSLCAALWAGVPVIAMQEATVDSNSATILTAAGCNEGIVATPADYVGLALRWAHDVNSWRSARRQRASQVRSSPLADAAALARHIESLGLESLSNHTGMIQ